MIYKSPATLFIKIAAIVAVGGTALWLLAVTVTNDWIMDWRLHPPSVEIPFWKRLLIYFAKGWLIVYPVLVGLAWVISLLTVELWYRLKARRL